MMPSRRPKRTLRSDLRGLRERTSKALRGGRSSGARGLRGAREQVGPALVSFGAVLGRVAKIVGATVVRIAMAIRRGAVAAVLAVAGLAHRIARAIRGRASGAVAAVSRAVTPKRTLAVVTLAAAALLAASQFTDYAGVTAGTPQYAGLEAEAPPPVVHVSSTGAAHGWALLAISILAVLALIVALRGRWRLARLISLAGVAGLAVALIVDLPKGLDTGRSGLAFAGAQAKLLDGFYIEVAAAAILALCGVLLARQLGAAAPQRRRRHA